MTFSIRDLAERFAVGERTVVGWIKSGELRAVNVSRRPTSRKPRWRISQEALEAFELSRTSSPQPRAPRRMRQPEVIEYYK